MLWKKKRKREKRKGEEPMKDNGNLKKKNIAFFFRFCNKFLSPNDFQESHSTAKSNKIVGKKSHRRRQQVLSCSLFVYIFIAIECLSIQITYHNASTILIEVNIRIECKDLFTVDIYINVTGSCQIYSASQQTLF